MTDELSLKQEEQEYKRFLEKKEYYEKLIEELKELSLDELRKDTNLMYEIIYARKYLEKYVSTDSEISEEVAYMIDIFAKIEDQGLNDVSIRNTHDKLLHLKYKKAQYHGEYEVERRSEQRFYLELVRSGMSVCIIILFITLTLISGILPRLTNWLIQSIAKLIDVIV